jgi:hypothetical protein
MFLMAGFGQAGFVPVRLLPSAAMNARRFG